MQELVISLSNEFFYSLCALSFCLGLFHGSILFYLAFRDVA